MKRISAIWSVAILVCFAPAAAGRENATRSSRLLNLRIGETVKASPQAAKAPQWKSRAEYDALMAANNEKDPNKKISLAEAFLQKFSDSDYKSSAYVLELQAYQQLNQPDKAVESARKAVGLDPDNLQALRFITFTFPFLYKPDAPDAAAKMSEAESDARHGLAVVQNLQKPPSANEEQFQQAVKDLRSVFNSCLGFVGLQRKDYTGAVASLKAATEDNPTSAYAFYWMGLANQYATPRDAEGEFWSAARAVALAKAANDPNAAEWEKYLKQTYVAYHGTDTGLPDILAQAAAGPTMPAGFKVVKPEPPKTTGNPNTDAFNTLAYPLKLGGETAQQEWDAVKGKPIELGGTVMSVEKGADPGVYLVRIAVLEATKSADGYDVELKDSSQPNVKNLSKGDLLRFRGTCDAYTVTPSFILAIGGQVTTELPDQPPTKAKPRHPH